MKELIKLLDEHLDYIDHELTGDTFFIYVASVNPDFQMVLS